MVIPKAPCRISNHTNNGIQLLAVVQNEGRELSICRLLNNALSLYNDQR